jgi:hypothetical protein
LGDFGQLWAALGLLLSVLGRLLGGFVRFWAIFGIFFPTRKKSTVAIAYIELGCSVTG